GDGAARAREPTRANDGQRVPEDCAAGDPDPDLRARAQGDGMAAGDRKKVKRAPGAGAEKRRLEKITRALEAMIAGDLEEQLPLSEAGDQLDAICYSVNILVGELAFATASFRRAQAEAEAANAAKSKVLRTASHELRTPLPVIVWLTELLRDPERVPPERFVRSLAGIRRS